MLWYEPIQDKLHEDEDSQVADGKKLNLGGKYASVTLQVIGTMTDASIEFEGSIDGENYHSLEGIDLSDGSEVTESGGNTGIFRVNIVGINYFRAKKTGSNTEPITVIAVVSPAAA